jgi:hypothetical protein
MLSSRLNEFVSPTIHSTDRPSLIAAELVRCHEKPSATAEAATAISPSSFAHTGRNLKSSTRPSSVISASRARTIQRGSSNTKMAAPTPAIRAIPPR